jgi:hypothetical protein
MNQSAIQDAAMYVAGQIEVSMRGLGRIHGSDDIYVFAIDVAGDFAAVFKAANTEGHYQRSSGGAGSRWQPSEWFANGMDIEIGPLNQLLEDPTYQPDPEKGKQRPKHQAEWLMVMVQGLRKAREAGHLQWSGRPVVAFCTVQDSGLGGWLACESARLVNPPDLWNQIEVEFVEAWEGWETDDEADKVRAAFEQL